jgi:MFS family permease
VLSSPSQDRWSDPLVRRLVRVFPAAMAFTVTLGVAPLLFLQLVYGRFVYSASIVSAWYWFLIIAAVILGYYSLYGASLTKRDGRKGPYLGVALAAAAFVSLVYSSVFSLAERPELARQLYAETQSGLAWNPRWVDTLLRWLHMVAGAVTVGGFFAAMLAADSARGQKLGKRFFLWGAVLSFGSGLAYLFSLGDIVGPFMRSPAIWILTLGILLTLAAVFLYHRGNLALAGAALFLSMLSMTISRHEVRSLRLLPHAASLPGNVVPQWPVFLIFLICFLVALGTCGVMLRLFFRTAEGQRSS